MGIAVCAELQLLVLIRTMDSSTGSETWSEAVVPPVRPAAPLHQDSGHPFGAELTAYMHFHCDSD